MKQKNEHSQAGQAMAEMALSIPVLILLFFGIAFAGYYAFRSSAVNWGVFITGVAQGSYNSPATGQARESVLWADIRQGITTEQVGDRQVRSSISIEYNRPWYMGLNLVEAQRAETNFRLWRFYPGPPEPGGRE